MTDAIEATRVCIDAAIKDGRVNDAWNMAKHAQMVKLAAVEQSNKIVATMRATRLRQGRQYGRRIRPRSSNGKNSWRTGTIRSPRHPPRRPPP